MRKIHPNSYAKSSQSVTGGEVSQTVMQKLRKSFERIKNNIGTRESDANIQRIKTRFNSTVI
ncbi:hypothetical protein M1N80_02590 [Peptococcaceae bacterium]|nr:hypothetical protein [Peptococcaceae bacterium]